MSGGGSPVVRFFGYLFMAIGALITLTSGACTVAFFDSRHMSESVVIGAPFIVLGIVVFALGRLMARRPQKMQPPSDVF